MAKENGTCFLMINDAKRLFPKHVSYSVITTRYTSHNMQKILQRNHRKQNQLHSTMALFHVN